MLNMHFLSDIHLGFGDKIDGMPQAKLEDVPAFVAVGTVAWHGNAG